MKGSLLAVSIGLTAALLLGCEDDARDLDYLKDGGGNQLPAGSGGSSAGTGGTTAGSGGQGGTTAGTGGTTAGTGGTAGGDEDAG